MTSVKIMLDEETKTYTVGKAIKGILKCVFGNHVDLEKITVAIIGTEKSVCSDATRCNLEDVCFWYKEELIPLSRLSSTLSVNRGTYFVPFEIGIPQHLPSTFLNHKVGRICYKVEAILHADGIKVDKEKITLVSPSVDLNFYPQKYRNPYSQSMEESVTLFCCTLGLVRLEVHFAKRLFLIGEPIKFRLTVDNKSRVRITSVCVAGCGRIYYKYSSSDDTLYSQDFSNMDDFVSVSGSVRRVGLHFWDVEVNPKDVSFPNFQGSKLFDFSYDLEIGVVMGCFITLWLKVSTKLGHVPLMLKADE